MPGGGYYNPLAQTTRHQDPIIGQSAMTPKTFGGSNGAQFVDLEQAGVYGANQALETLQGDLPAYDPNNYIGQVTDNLANGQNPFLQGFQNFQAQANPYADQLYNQGADQIRDRINSQFGASGQGNSSLNFDTQLGDLSNYTAQYYGGIYDNQQDRYLQSLGMGNQAYQNQTAQQATLLPDLLSNQQGAPWQNLQNYASIVSQLSPTAQPEIPEPEKASGFDKLLGIGALGLSGFGGGLF